MSYDYEVDEWYSGLDPVRGVRYTQPLYARPPRRPAYYADRRPSENYLSPGGHYAAGGRTRARSTGGTPVPNIHVHNYMDQHQEAPRTEQVSPAPSPRGRPVRIAGEELIDELELTRRALARSRSRGRSDAAYHHHHHEEQWWAPSPRYDLQLELAQQRAKDAEARWQREQEEELIRRRVELQYMKDKAERDAEEARIRADEERYKEKLRVKFMREKQEQDAERERLKAEAEKVKKEMELKMLRQQQEREEEEQRLKDEKDKLKKEFELKQEQDARKREQAARDAEDLKKRIILENTAKLRQAEEDAENLKKQILLENTIKLQKAENDAKDAKQRAIDEYEKKRAKEEKEAKEERQRIIDEYERKKVDDAKKQKEMEDALIAKLKKQAEDNKAKEEAEYKEFLRKQKGKADEEAAKKKAKEEEMAREMHDRLAQFGFVENQIQAMIDPKKTRELQQGQSPANPLQLARQPTYIKVHRDHLLIDTLTYYGLPWEYDRDDDHYIIILRELDRRDTDLLFEHTRKLRHRGTSQLLIEQRNPNKQEYAWVRRKATPSPNGRRRRSSPRRFGIATLFS
ncbi:hypothetical protein H2201_001342 [Coniosporium apollinis]|uniref:Uncharacterized protein n=2 Tax=Coniosporium TaxID=2810619 RepID=A0ABQ9P259_9PEZI|nr:hypothetical protein H2199_001752 [Cladosporium sp. JES 115]KAJ9668699.1 hypothetical protein H2201_001342 [Coniosporium apollinis]